MVFSNQGGLSKFKLSASINSIRIYLFGLAVHLNQQHRSVGGIKHQPDAFDLVITDMAMPSMAGEQLTRKIHSIRPGLPVILCTGFGDRITREKAAAIGMSGILKKPVLRSAMAR